MLIMYDISFIMYDQCWSWPLSWSLETRPEKDDQGDLKETIIGNSGSQINQESQSTAKKDEE